MCDMKNLVGLDLRSCECLQRLPEKIGTLTMLRRLDLGCCTGLSSLPASIGELNGLELLDLSNCTSLLSIPKAVGRFHKVPVDDDKESRLPTQEGPCDG